MKKQGVILLGLLAACLLVLLFAQKYVEKHAVAATEVVPYRPDIAIVTYEYSDSNYYREFSRTAVEYGRRHGYEVQVLDGEGNSMTQIGQVETLAARGVGAIIIDPSEPHTLDKALKQAMDSGVYVVVTGKETQHKHVYYNSDHYTLGYELGSRAAAWINAKCDGSANVALLVGPDLVNLQARERGIRDALRDEAPAAQILYASRAINVLDGMEVTEVLLNGNSQLQVLLCVNDDGALGALEALSGFSIDANGFFLGSIDGTKQFLLSMVDNPLTKAAVATDIAGDAVACMQAAISLIEQRDSPTLRGQVRIIDQDNLEDYLQD